ncbi:ABC transporter permease [Actinokineospora xionganensis]|uniref:ABC transporter permease n=1 Tax=Actinokineospora xionganensis TaxID=2684470 RepID=UPI0028A97CA9|nr:ABC transporter permease [Actinokineospora xionganensis]
MILGAVAALLFVLPLIGLVIRVPWPDLGTYLADPRVLDALWLSLVCSLGATVVCLVFGIPLAWLQVRVSFPGRGLLRAITTLPVVLPPVVGGVALLLVFGRKGFVGEPLYNLTGISLPFTTAGTILAEAFVAMPFLILTIGGALQSMDTRLEDAARTLSASRWTVFWRVTLPTIRPSLIAGTVLCWARALGEFGATITFAGNFPGRTQTLPLAVYVALETDTAAAITLSMVMLAISLGVLIGLRRHWFGVQ